MPDAKSKIMNVLKKFKIVNPRTGNKIEIPSALASDDPKLKDLGKKKAKDIISKAKEKMKGGGIDKKLDKDGSITVKGYEKDAGGYDDSNPMRAPIQIAPKAKKSFTIKKGEPKPSTNPDDYSADGQYLGPGGGISPGGQRVQNPYNPKGMSSDDPSSYDPEADAKRKKRAANYSLSGGGSEFHTDNPNRMGTYIEPDDYSSQGDYLGPGGGISPGGQRVSGVSDKPKKKKSDSDYQDPFNPAGMSPDDPMFYDPEKERRRLRKLGRTGRELSRKEAKQYIQKNKQKVFEQLLKKIIKEETKKVLNEGTRWLVGIEGGNGKILSTYGHYDGYPKHTGQLLKKIYNTPSKVKQLMKLGKQGISFLDKSMRGGKDHSFDNRKDGESIFYGRDRGEKGNMTSNWKNRDKVKFDSGEEYAYIYNLKEKKWYYKSRYSNPQDWTEL